MESYSYSYSYSATYGENTIAKIKIADTSYIYYVQPENGVTFSYLTSQLSNIIAMIGRLDGRVRTLEEKVDNYDPYTPSHGSNGSND